MATLPPYMTGLLAVLLLSSFVKIATTLSILTFGLGLRGAGFGVAVLTLSLGLSFVVMTPQLAEVGGTEALLAGNKRIDIYTLRERFVPFLERHSDPSVRDALTKLQQEIGKGANRQASGSAAKKLDLEMPHESDDSPRAQLHNGHGEQIEQAKVDPFGVAIAAFLVTELRSAFELGFMILLPFLIIDLLVTNILVLLGIEQLSHFVVAVPLKLLLFVVVDGWALIAERLVASYL